MTAYVVYAFKEPKGSSSVEYESLGRYVCEDRNRAVDLWREENPAKAQTLDCISDRIKIVALVDSCGI
tara:strand:- start:379 stop:582 length:204 start_codon:yes stop_codon:yes gene_type:complete